MAKTNTVPQTNPELESFQNSQKQSRKTRFFSLMSYATDTQIQKVLKKHIKSIRAFCYIHHDKDESEPHYHIIIRTHSTWTSVQLRKWFYGLTDKEKKPVNTFCEPANDLVALKEYLTHSDPDSIEKGKYRYDEADIYDCGMWDLVPRGDSYDDCYEIVNKILAGYSYRQLCMEYGKKFLYHWDKFDDLAGKIRIDEGFREAKSRALMELHSIYYDNVNLKKIDDMEDF